MSTVHNKAVFKNPASWNLHSSAMRNRKHKLRRSFQTQGCGLYNYLCASPSLLTETQAPQGQAPLSLMTCNKMRQRLLSWRWVPLRKTATPAGPMALWACSRSGRLDGHLGGLVPRLQSPWEAARDQAGAGVGSQRVGCAMSPRSPLHTRQFSVNDTKLVMLRAGGFFLVPWWRSWAVCNPQMPGEGTRGWGHGHWTTGR